MNFGDITFAAGESGMRGFFWLPYAWPHPLARSSF
jgi:hypothetical protein